MTRFVDVTWYSRDSVEEDDPLILAPSIMREGRMHALIVKGWAFS